MTNMPNEKDNYQKLMGGLQDESAPSGLYRAVILHLASEQKRVGKKKFALAGLALLVSIGAAVSAVLVLAGSLSESGFWKFVSLAFSDGDMMLTYWRQFAMSLLESFSAPEFIVSLICVFAALLSLRFLMKNKNIISSSNKLQLV